MVSLCNNYYDVLYGLRNLFFKAAEKDLKAEALKGAVKHLNLIIEISELAYEQATIENHSNRYFTNRLP